MSRKWVLGLVAVLAIAVTAVTAAGVFGGGSPGRPDYAKVEVKMRAGASSAGRKASKQAKKPTVVYLQGERETVDVDALGPYVDIMLRSCPGKSRVLDGGVRPMNTGVYEQGNYIPNDKEYHVVIGFETGATPVDFEFTSHLVCIKGVK